MISKIVWPYTSTQGNPFGGVNGFRPMRLTFHSSSFTNMVDIESTALNDLIGLAQLEDIDAMSFDELIQPKIAIETEKAKEEYIGIRVVNSGGETVSINLGVHKSNLTHDSIGRFLGVIKSGDEERIRAARQDILEARAHGVLSRDIFITTSKLLLDNRERLSELNIYTPHEALKIVGLYLRMRGEFEWVSQVKGKVRIKTSRRLFYQFVCRGKLPGSWRYISGLGLHPDREKLIELGWSTLNRCSRAIQARDEIGRLFYMEPTQSTQDQIAYHFDYLTLLLTGALDAWAAVINEVYSLGIKDYNLGFRRSGFRNALKKTPGASNLESALATKEDFINILFDLRNKIHSTSLGVDFYVPESYPDELLERIYKFDPNSHWGVQKEKVNLVRNGGPAVPSFNYSVDMYTLASGLIDEGFKLINYLMDETGIESYLASSDVAKIQKNAPVDMAPYIEAYLLLT